MPVKRVSCVVLVASAVMLAVGVGPRLGDTTRALSPAQAPGPPGVTIPYPGRLSDDAGQPVADGAYDFTFELYDAEMGGARLWSEVQDGLAVREGTFTVLLGSVNPISVEALNGGERWLAVAVRGPEETELAALTPRQRLTEAEPARAAAPAAGLACPHDHWGETWESDSGVGLRLSNSGPNPGWIALGALGGPAVESWSMSYTGVEGRSALKDGVHGEASASNKSGVFGSSTDGFGVTGRSQNNYGVQGFGVRGVHGVGSLYGVYGTSSSGNGVMGESTIGAAVVGDSDTGAAVAGYAGSGPGLVSQSVSGDLINGYGEADGADIDFRVSNNGTAYADGGWQGSADFAELMSAEGDVDAYEPGDVLAISTRSDRAVALSSEPRSALVIGVYSEKPGFVGSPHVMEGQRADEIPVAVLGIVPCKVSIENGPIHRGDLLVTSSKPGHAMRANAPAPGTVLGKALEPLGTGTGIILVLVTLQ